MPPRLQGTDDRGGKQALKVHEQPRIHIGQDVPERKLQHRPGHPDAEGRAPPSRGIPRSPSARWRAAPPCRMSTKLLAAVTRAKPTITKAVWRMKVWAVTMVLTRNDQTVPPFSPRRNERSMSSRRRLATSRKIARPSSAVPR